MNSPTQGQPNRKKKRLKWHLDHYFFSHGKCFFVGLGVILFRKTHYLEQETQPNEILRKHPSNRSLKIIQIIQIIHEVDYIIQIIQIGNLSALPDRWRSSSGGSVDLSDTKLEWSNLERALLIAHPWYLVGFSVVLAAEHDFTSPMP